MARAFLTRWTLIVILLAAVALGVGGWLAQQPNELERSILSSLSILKEAGRLKDVHILRTRQLFAPSDHCVDLLTVQLRIDSDYFLAHLRSSRKSVREEHSRWITNPAHWQRMRSRPSAADVSKFDEGLTPQLERMRLAGLRPRPADQVDFRVTRIFVRFSDDIPDIDPAQTLDAAHLAALVLADVGDFGRPSLRQFVLAPFHEPEWFPAAQGLAAVRGRIHFLEVRQSRNPQATGGQRNPDLEVLRQLESQLEIARRQDVKFYFLAEN